MTPIILYFKNSSDGYDEHNLFITDHDRKAGTVTVPVNVTANANKITPVTRYKDRVMGPGQMAGRSRALYWDFAAGQA